MQVRNRSVVMFVERLSVTPAISSYTNVSTQVNDLTGVTRVDRRSVTSANARPTHTYGVRTLRTPSPTGRHPAASFALDREGSSPAYPPAADGAIGGRTDVGVDTRSRPTSSLSCVLCTSQVPDQRPAPNREVAYLQECIQARKELAGCLCRCRTCVEHSTLARRRMGPQTTTTPPPLSFVMVSLHREASSLFQEWSARTYVACKPRPPPP